MYILKNYADKRTLSKPSFELIFHNMKLYMKKSIISIFSFYGEFIAFEINTYFAAILHDVDELDIWVTTVNFSLLFYVSSIGLGFTMRNLVSVPWGKG